ncbi:MAG: cupin domain-containing protein [Caulobacterales bacterium]
MDTRLGRLSSTPASSGLPAGLRNPIKPEQFAGKHEAQLGKRVGVTQFGVNHLVLEPGSVSALRHWHEFEDEFVYVLSGELVLIDENGEHGLSAGDFAGFPAGAANAHHLVNKSASPATYLVIGTRKRGREVIHYPDDNLGPITVLRDASGDRVT